MSEQAGRSSAARDEARPGEVGGTGLPGGPTESGGLAGGGEPAGTAGPAGSGGLYETPSGKPSGLKNPVRAARSLGAMALVTEAIVLLLALAPLRMLQGGLPGGQLWVVLGAIVLAVVASGLLKRPLGWWLGTILQVGLIVAGFWQHWLFGAVGVIFGLVWGYVLHVRRTVTA